VSAAKNGQLDALACWLGLGLSQGIATQRRVIEVHLSPKWLAHCQHLERPGRREILEHSCQLEESNSPEELQGSPSKACEKLSHDGNTAVF